MKEIVLTRRFLRKTYSVVGVLVGVLFFFEGFSWTVAYDHKIDKIKEVGGPGQYVFLSLTSVLIPEICTISVLIILINLYHRVLDLRKVDSDSKAVLRYQILLLPLFGLAFFIFNPFTETVRFLTENFPDYSTKNYWTTYILGTYTLRIYLLYLIPVCLFGYIVINISLVNDYSAQRLQFESDEKMRQQNVTPAPSLIQPYLITLPGRTHQGETILQVADCSLFNLNDRHYFANLPDGGRYQIQKTINDLEDELDPMQFLRVNRSTILNRQSVDSYSFWEKGKYIIRMKAPYQELEIIMPRARLQDFKDWLAGRPLRQETASEMDDDETEPARPANL